MPPLLVIFNLDGTLVDSEVGLQAAAAAGMRALHFVPHRANEMQLADNSFKAMAQLPHLLERMAVVA